MSIFSGLGARAGVLRNEPPKSPWGGKPGGGGDNGSGKGGGGGPPRNPWSFPPEGRRPRPGGPTALDELLKRAKRGGGGGGFPGGNLGSGRLWAIGAAAIVAIWLVVTSFQSIGPQERGVVTFFGRYSRVLEPGIHLTFPAPINTVQKVNVRAIRDENFPASGSGENLMLTGDQNIINLGYQVRWNITNPQDFVFQIKTPEETVRATAESAMRAVVADVTLDQAIGRGRTVIEARVQQVIQTILDDYDSGISIQGVAISKADPPDAVNDDFKAVSAAQQGAQANLNNARAYAQQVIARAQGEAAQFDKIYVQYKASPEVTRRRLYYETMEQVLAKSNKTIVEAPGVTPYLPLPEARRTLPEPGATTPPAVQQGGTAMNAVFRNPMIAGIAVLALVILLLSTFTIVDEKRQAVVLRFEVPQRTINAWQPNTEFGNTGAGVIARIPFVDRIVWVDKRVLDVELDNQPVLSTDQLRLQVDAYARFRVVDPLKMVVTARSEDGVTSALQPLFSSSLRAELGKRDFAVLLSPERGEVMDRVQDRLQRLASQYGVQIVDVRIKHADLPEGTPLESALNRMRTARQQQALTITAQGQRNAQIVRADADAQASKIYSDAFGKDPGFYDFYRAMQSYRYTFGADGNADNGRGGTSIILSPQNGYLREFRGGN